ncbi:MAG: ATP-binding protein [Pseudomonadota bacterium]
MLAAVSHDLRTPLTRMTLELEMVDESSQPHLGDLHHDVDEMRELVEAYLSFARDESQELVEPTALGPIFEQMRERADRSGKSLAINLPRSISVPLRPIAFRRCISNLVDNACRYGSEISISGADLKDHVQITIEDNGPGIPPSHREKALQPFIRLDQQEPRRVGGTGLGLTIALDIILAHGGELKLDESSLGGLMAAIKLPH